MALPFLKESVKKPGINHGRLADMAQGRVSFLHELRELFDFIDSLPDYCVSLYVNKKMKTNEAVARDALLAAHKVLSGLDEFTQAGISEALASAAQEAGLAKGQILWSVRTATSGKAQTPCGAADICELLGKDEALARIKGGMERLA